MLQGFYLFDYKSQVSIAIEMKIESKRFQGMKSKQQQKVWKRSNLRVDSSVIVTHVRKRNEISIKW